jgi:predicted nucleic acid-binding Zn ribbon protein
MLVRLTSPAKPQQEVPMEKLKCDRCGKEFKYLIQKEDKGKLTWLCEKCLEEIKKK